MNKIEEYQEAVFKVAARQQREAQTKIGPSYCGDCRHPEFVHNSTKTGCNTARCTCGGFRPLAIRA